MAQQGLNGTALVFDDWRSARKLLKMIAKLVGRVGIEPTTN
jgi:hypothetical protein